MPKHLAFLSALTLFTTLTATALARGGLTDGGGQPAPSHACSGLVGSTFQSVRLYEGGLTPNGPSLSHWRVTFNESDFQYSLSDFGIAGHYTCSEPEGAVTTDRNDFPLDGYYNAATGSLLWHGRWFQKAK